MSKINAHAQLLPRRPGRKKIHLLPPKTESSGISNSFPPPPTQLGISPKPRVVQGQPGDIQTWGAGKSHRLTEGGMGLGEGSGPEHPFFPADIGTRSQTI